VTALVTGAAGTIGRMLTTRLPAMGWQIRTLDKVALDGRETVVGDITDPSVMDAAMQGVNAVVHLAGQPTEAPWPVIQAANIEGTFQVFEAARRAGVRRLIFASSNHAVGYTPRPDGHEQPGGRDQPGGPDRPNGPDLPGGRDLPDDVPARPDTLYGVSKAFGEALARYYVDRYGMQVACLRIGTCSETPPDARAQATWLSPDDCARLVDACLRAENLTFALVWGVSANRDRWWSQSGGRALGYQPRDDAASHLPGPPPEAKSWDNIVGGPYTDPYFGIDEVAERAQKGSR